MADEARSRLGRGLAALIGRRRRRRTRRSAIRSRRRPRLSFCGPIRGILAKPSRKRICKNWRNSIRERGIVQPILVRAIPSLNNVYEIIAGERRWRAAQRAGLHEAPIVIVEADDRESLEIAIIENVQRADLNALEEAKGYERLTEEFGYSQQDHGQDHRKEPEPCCKHCAFAQTAG